MDWWNGLTDLQQILATIAIPATLIMIVQFILLLFGFADDGAGDSADTADIPDGADLGDIDDVSLSDMIDSPDDIDFAGDTDIDISGDVDIDTSDAADSPETDVHDAGHGTEALKLFTIRGFIGFFSIGGWFGVAAISWGIPAPVALALAFAAGYLAMYFVAWSVRAAMRLQHNGTINLKNAIGNNGEVYIPIPPSKSGLGKVNVIVQERLCELSAVTSAERMLKTGEKITVMGIEKEGVLLVVPKDPPEGVIIEKEIN